MFMEKEGEREVVLNEKDGKKGEKETQTDRQADRNRNK